MVLTVLTVGMIVTVLLTVTNEEVEGEGRGRREVYTYILKGLQVLTGAYLTL